MTRGGKWLLLALGAALAFEAKAQTAEVTIYTHGSWASQMKPISHNAIFTGGIWDGGEPILMFIDRPYQKNDRYVVLQLPAGVHVFGTGEGNQPRKSSLLTLKLEPGQRYFLRVHAASNDFTIPGYRANFETVTCDEAHEDLAHGTSLDERSVMKEKRGLLAARQEIPVCPVAQP